MSLIRVENELVVASESVLANTLVLENPCVLIPWSLRGSPSNPWRGFTLKGYEGAYAWQAIALGAAYHLLYSRFPNATLRFIEADPFIVQIVTTRPVMSGETLYLDYYHDRWPVRQP